MKITTNGHKRELRPLGEFSVDVQAEHDTIVGDDVWSMRMFTYKGMVVDSHDFVRIVPMDVMSAPFSHRTSNEDVLQWEWIATDSMWSALVLRLVQDEWGDYDVVVGQLLD